MDPKQKNQEQAQEIIREYNDLVGARGTLEAHLQEIAERIWPQQSRTFNPNQERTEGEKLNQEIFDSTATLALNRFGAILDSLLTPRNQTWHRIQASDPALNKARRVKLYFDEVNSTLFRYRYAPMANFASQNQQNYKSLGAFGTGCMYTDKLGGDPGLRYRMIHLGEIYFAENHQGIVDKGYRGFKLTARQAIQKFGDSVPEQIREIAKRTPERKFTFIHCTKPRRDYDKNRLDVKGKHIGSYYVSKDYGTMLEEGGFRTFPYSISRYEQAPGDVYGRSIAMDLLPAIKTLNEEKKTILKQGHRIVDPVLLAHDDGIVDTFSLRPGTVNAGGVSADGRPLVHALPTGNLAIGKELMDDERQLINDGFLISLFQILTENPQMTATEVLERTKEKGMLLAPTIGRQQSEYLGPMIERELDLLAEQGLLPPMPPELIEAEGEFQIQYDSPLSRAQRAEEASGLMRTVENALQVVNVTQNPEPLDHFNWDTIIPEIGEIQGVPARWMRSMQEVQQLRAGRAQQAQTETMINAAPGAAAMVNAVGKAQGKV